MRHRLMFVTAALVTLAGAPVDTAFEAHAQNVVPARPAQRASEPAVPVRCARFAPESSTAYDPVAKKIALPWRGDLPTILIPTTHTWERINFEDWRGYMAAVLSEVRAARPKIEDRRFTMAPDAKWWVVPWMDFSVNGREPIHGLTNERGPDPGDLSSHSPGGLQTWAVGFYNAEGAYGVSQVFADPCDPKLPKPQWTFPDGSASFKFLFTNADKDAVDYLKGSPEIEAYINDAAHVRAKQIVRLLQADIAVRDNRSPTGWVFGTYVWVGPPKGDGLIDNLEPVGLMWGNDPDVDATPLDAFADLQQTRLNMELAGRVWRGSGQKWSQRPWPGFQGRLNGPADNLRSSCLSCHALAQWPRSAIGIVPTGEPYGFAALANAMNRAMLRRNYMRNVRGGTLAVPGDDQPSDKRDKAVPLDYSLQLEAAFNRICEACAMGVLQGTTPAVCKVRRPAKTVITTATCPSPRSKTEFSTDPRAISDDPPPRQ